MRRRSRVPLFITKLLQMVDNQQISAIGWTSAGDAFSISSVTRFTEEVLPRYFKHSNYASFIRQLNMYGFRKIPHTEGENVYMNQHFRAGARNQLRHITRRVREQREEGEGECRGAKVGQSRELGELRSNQKILEQMFRQMVIQNQRLAEFNQNLAKKIENKGRAREQRMEELLLRLMVQERREIAAGQILPIGYGEGSAQLATTPLHVGASLQQADSCPKAGGLIDSLYAKIKEIKQGGQPAKPSAVVFTAEEDDFLSIDKFMDADEFQKSMHLQQSR